MKWHNKIANRLVLVVMGGLALMFITAQVSLLSVQKNVNGYSELLENEVNARENINQINIAFKEQVQEWKNVLVRGSDEKQRTKYWNQFQTREAAVRQLSLDLSKSLKMEEEKKLIESFIRTHRDMGEAYRKGYKAFTDANFDMRVGDEVVKGLDREPAELLKSLSDDIASEVDEKSKELLVATQNSYYITLVIFGLIVLSLSIASYVLIQKMIVAPIMTLMADLNHLSDGHLNHKVEYENENELGQIAESARTLQKHLQTMISEVKETSELVYKTAQEFTDKSQLIASHTNEQHMKTDQVATAMQEMSSTAEEVSNHAQSAADSAEAADSTATAGCGVMTNTISQMDRLADEVKNAGGVINNLQEKTNAIGSVLDVIKNIAEQTNLLALNAAIEAARAGEQGRGFAVVADEVRTLAQRTQSSTAEIQKIIEAVQEGAQKAVSAMETSQTHSSSCVELVDSAGSMLEQIRESIGQIKDMNLQIATAAEEQTLVAKDISENIENIASSSDITHQKAGEISDASGQLSENAAKLQRNLKHFVV